MGVTQKIADFVSAHIVQRVKALYCVNKEFFIGGAL